MRFPVLLLVLSAQSVLCSSEFYVLSTADSGARSCGYSDPCATLIQALTATLMLPNSELYLLDTHSVLDLLDSVTVEHSLTLYGNQNVVRLLRTITVLSGGQLTLCNVTIESAGDSGTEVLAVFGSVKTDYLVVRSCRRVAFAVHSGELYALRTRFENNTNAGIRVDGGATAGMDWCEVERQVGNFIDFVPSNLSGPVRVALFHSSFRYCSSNFSAYLVEFRLSRPNTNDKIDVLSCTFQHNSIRLFSIEMAAGSLRFADSTFEGNSKPIVNLRLYQLSAGLSGCSWVNNSALLVDADCSDVELVISNALVSNQSEQGMFRFSGASSCQVVLTNSSILNSTLVASSQGLVLATACYIAVSNTSIAHTKVIGEGVSQRMSFFFVEMASLELRGVHAFLSGSSFFFLLGISSSIFVANCTFERIIAGGNVALGVVMGDLLVESTVIAGVEQDMTAYSSTGFAGPVLLGCYRSHAAIRNFFAASQSNQGYALVLTASFSTFAVTDMRLEGIRTDLVLLQLHSLGSVARLTVRDVKFRTFLMHLGLESELNLTAFDAKQVSVTTPLRGLFCVASNSKINVSQSIIADTRGSFLLLASDSSAFIGHTIVENAVLELVVGSTVSAQIKVVNVTISRSRGGLANIVASDMSVIDTRVDALTSDQVLLNALLCKVVMKRVVVSGIVAIRGLGKVADDSTFEVADSSFRAIVAETGEGFVLKDSTLILSHTTFSDFSATLFQVFRSNVTVTNSTFSNGVNPIQSRKSDKAYGAVMGCTDCYYAKIDGITVVNVSSAVGGALAFRSVRTGDLVTMQESKFILCSAMEGGAIFLKSVSFVIESSSFTYNRANSHGGAIFIDVGQMHERTIRDCFFLGNVAVEGGAVKWRNAELNFADITFRENQAEYGPDVASFGVAISSRLTKLTVPPVSGQPLLLVFEVVDHYGNRVTTASNQVLTLQPSRTVTFGGNPSSISNKGVFRFQDAIVYAEPNSTQQIVVMMQESISLTGSVELAFRNCTAGEIYRSTMCEACLIGNVSYSPDAENCEVCPQRASCYGGTNMTVLQGNWRAATNSTTVLHCPLPSKCLGGVNSTCAEGFAGKLCAQCDRGRYRLRLSDCAECGNVHALAFQLCLAVGILLAFLCAVVVFTFKRIDEMRLFLIKSIFNHAQLLSITFPLRAAYPYFISGLLQAVSYPSSLLLTDLPLSCFSFSEYTRALISSLFPLCLTFIFAGFSMHQKLRRLSTVLLTSCLLFTPAAVVQTLAPLLACQSVDGAEKWLFVDLSERCWGNSHSFIVRNVLIPSAVLNVVLPICSFSAISSLRPKTFRDYFPLWTAGYKRVDWECFLSLSKCCSLWIMFVTLTYNSIEQIAYGLITLIVISVINVVFQKYTYKSWVYFLISEVSFVITAISLGLVSFYTFYSPSNSTSDHFISVAFGVVNCGYFCACGYLLVRPGSALTVLSRQYESGAMRVPNNSFSDEGVPSSDAQLPAD